MASRKIYVCDADCLINLHRHFARKAIKVLQLYGERGWLKIPEGVVREIVRSTDKLAKFVQKARPSISTRVTDDPRPYGEITRLEKQYGQTIVFGQIKYDGFWGVGPADRRQMPKS